MKRWIAGLLVLGLLTFVVAGPTPAEAGGRPYRHHGHSHGGAPVLGALAVGAVSGLILGSIFAPRVYAAPAPEPVYVAPAPVYVAPAPVYVAPAPVYAAPAPVYAAPAPVYVAPPAPPVCTSYWVNTYMTGAGWVPGHWEQVCR